MGSIFSQIRLTVGTLLAIARAYNRLAKRVALSPGIPIPNPSTPYWTIPASPIAKHGHEKLPEYADVVIIGSGITGTSFARKLLDGYYDSENDLGKRPLKVVMLDARDACYGATGRNGGHVSPFLYAEYPELKKKLGSEEAKAIIRFRLTHIEELLRVAEEEDLLVDSQTRRVQAYDVYHDRTLFEDMKGRLAVYLEDMPEEKEKWAVIEDRASIQALQLSDLTVGILSTPAGASHPYRLVTGILERLLNSYPDLFYLFTNTPCTSIEAPSSGLGTDHSYTIKTPRGTIRAPHVVHATNAWAAHLLEPMRSKIIPGRGVMTAQRPGRSLGRSQAGLTESIGTTTTTTSTSFQDVTSKEVARGDWRGQRSFVFYPGQTEEVFDYLTQMPPPPPSSSPSSFSSNSKYPHPSAEFMFGGGFLHCSEGGFLNFDLADIGNVDDSTWSSGVEAYLAGALASGSDGGHFNPKHWGEEGRPEDDRTRNEDKNENKKHREGDFDRDEEIGKGRVKKTWSGIIGFSADRMPWVGRLPAKISGRKGPRVSTKSSSGVPEGKENTTGLSAVTDDVTLVDSSCEREKVSTYKSAPSPNPNPDPNPHLAPPGEWIAAGFTGEGMTHAWMSAKALAYMVLGKENSDDGFLLPESFRVTEKRWKKARLEDGI
ncbi:hypothetical protein D9758_007295 [Tetrapyrgos nigripes]|uniref:FAD dependent oxidoreductase domain-containing protein n=1 Tax=Tetrapyrgos nigripes TaxID=182062 RepID=A0A8H5GAZ6_9AGAR|nr:hypothetical protein D9758_007295 [Tetrapyrgos nigripes]